MNRLIDSQPPKHPQRPAAPTPPRLWGGLVFLCWFLTAVGPWAAPPGEKDRIAQALYDNALVLLRAGTTEQAVADLKKVYTSFPESAFADKALYALGEFYLDRGDRRQARQAFQRIIERYEGRSTAPGAYLQRGILAAEPSAQGTDLRAAFADFTRVASLYPGSPWVAEALLRGAEAGLRLGELDAALDQLDQLAPLDLTEELADRAELLRGLILAYQGRPIRAVETFQRLIDRRPGSPAGTRALGFSTALVRRLLRGGKLDGRLYRLDATFDLQTALKKPLALAMRPAPLTGPPESALVVADRKQSKVLKIDVQGRPQGTLSLANPVDFCADSFQRLWMVSRSTARVGTEAWLFKVPERRAAGKDPRPEGDPLVPLADLQVVCGDLAGGAIALDGDLKYPQRFAADRSYAAPLIAGVDRRPVDLAVDLFGNIILLAPRKHVLLIRLAPDGTILDQVPEKTQGIEVDRPEAVALDPFGHLYVLDSGAQRILCFDAALTLFGTIDLQAEVGLKKPIDLTVDDTGRVYVLDGSRKTIVAFH